MCKFRSAGVSWRFLKLLKLVLGISAVSIFNRLTLTLFRFRVVFPGLLKICRLVIDQLNSFATLVHGLLINDSDNTGIYLAVTANCQRNSDVCFKS